MAISVFNPSNNPTDYTSYYAPGTAAQNAAGATSFSTLSVGYAGDIGWSVPSNQLATIVSSLDASNPDGISTIIGIMEKPFSMSTSSNWQNLIGLPSGVANQIVQAVSGGKISGYSVYSTRRIWSGSDPLSLNLTLKFYAVNDPYNEVISPVMRLYRMSAPSYQTGNVSLLTPPGPNPYSFSATNPSSVTGDDIEIYIGGFLLFNPVIVKRVTGEWDNRYDQNGYPMGATVQIEFETYQVMTKSDISNTLQGPGGALSQPLQQTTSNTANTTTSTGGS